MTGLLVPHPEIALFIAIALGHLIGAIRFGPIQLGGVCGTLIVALVLGQTGVQLDAGIKSLFFALFIFALGYTGGPQFFAHLASGWRFAILSLVEVTAVLFVVLTAAILLSLNAGAAAGLLAGAATESAAIGTASEAIGHLGLAPDMVQSLQGQIATAYSITYLFGLVTIVLFTSQVAPAILGIDLRQASAELARKMGEAVATGQNALPDLIGRAFIAGPAGDSSVGAFEAAAEHFVTITRIHRGDRIFEPGVDEPILPDDQLMLVGRRGAVLAVGERLGPEITGIGVDLPLVVTDFVLSRAEVRDRTIAEIRALAPLDIRRGVYIAAVRRMGREIPVLPGTALHLGDVISLHGPARAVAAAGAAIGRPMPAATQTDFIMLGMGIVCGALIGMAAIDISGIHLTLGVGGGCLLSGLIFGWYASHHAGRGVLPTSAAQILKDFGLAAFIAAVGFSAGPDALRLIRELGLWLPLAGVIAVLLPATLSLLIGHRILKIEPPLLLGAIAGQQCSTPAISALVSASGSSIPVTGYTVTYALSNVLLPLLGPVVVGLVFHLG